MFPYQGLSGAAGGQYSGMSSFNNSSTSGRAPSMWEEFQASQEQAKAAMQQNFLSQQQAFVHGEASSLLGGLSSLLGSAKPREHGEYQQQEMYDPIANDESDEEGAVFKKKRVNLIRPEEKSKMEIKLKGGHRGRHEESNPWYCELCDVTCLTEKSFYQHSNGMLHAQRSAQEASARQDGADETDMTHKKLTNQELTREIANMERIVSESRMNKRQKNKERRRLERFKEELSFRMKKQLENQVERNMRSLMSNVHKSGSVPFRQPEMIEEDDDGYGEDDGGVPSLVPQYSNRGQQQQQLSDPTDHYSAYDQRDRRRDYSEEHDRSGRDRRHDYAAFESYSSGTYGEPDPPAGGGSLQDLMKKVKELFGGNAALENPGVLPGLGADMAGDPVSRDFRFEGSQRSPQKQPKEDENWDKATQAFLDKVRGRKRDNVLDNEDRKLKVAPEVTATNLLYKSRAADWSMAGKKSRGPPAGGVASPARRGTKRGKDFVSQLVDMAKDPNESVDELQKEELRSKLAAVRRRVGGAGGRATSNGATRSRDEEPDVVVLDDSDAEVSEGLKELRQEESQQRKPATPARQQGGKQGGKRAPPAARASTSQDTPTRHQHVKPKTLAELMKEEKEKQSQVRKEPAQRGGPNRRPIVLDDEPDDERQGGFDNDQPSRAQNQQGLPDDVGPDDLALCQQLASMTGVTDVSVTMKVVQMMKTLDPSVLALLGRLDPAMVQGVAAALSAGLIDPATMEQVVRLVADSGSLAGLIGNLNPADAQQLLALTGQGQPMGGQGQPMGGQGQPMGGRGQGPPMRGPGQGQFEGHGRGSGGFRGEGPSRGFDGRRAGEFDAPRDFGGRSRGGGGGYLGQGGSGFGGRGGGGGPRDMPSRDGRGQSRGGGGQRARRYYD